MALRQHFLKEENAFFCLLQIFKSPAAFYVYYYFAFGNKCLVFGFVI